MLFLRSLTHFRAPWTCTRCKKNQENKQKISAAFSESQSSIAFGAPTYNSPYSHSHSAPKSVVSEPTKESPKIPGMKLGILCEIAGCNNFFFALPSGSRPLCPKHRMEQQYKSAKAAPPKPAPAPRAINKHKLHTIKPDDKPYVKKKRPVGKRSSSGNQQDMDLELQSMQSMQSIFPLKPPEIREFTFKPPEPIRSPPTPTRPSPRSAFKRTPEQHRRQTSKLKSPEEVEKAVDDLNRSLGSASMAESPIEPTPGWQGSWFSR